ncbi:oxygenase MpaB family protein [Nocardia mikamii]|uniref:oxygenase MpaB family protein n=1 Tax=Nocardia mikamii TaxID=508464 RepID=UPI0007A408DC|nr:oxygenase MpaB family protein [Nocardia mikamii]
MGNASRTSLLHRYVGDRRFLLALPRAVGLQILHPSIAAALDEHMPPMRLWYHKRRTVSRTIRAAYEDRDHSHFILGMHQHVKGVDDRGARYHALNPELFFFQHATYVETLVFATNTLIAPLSDRDHERLYEECCEWYLRFGVSARDMPADWAAFVDYFEQTCATRLRLGPAARTFAPEVIRPSAWIPRYLPTFAVREVLHPRARALFGVHPEPGDHAAFRSYARGLRLGAAVAPSWLRYLPSARATLAS